MARASVHIAYTTFPQAAKWVEEVTKLPQLHVFAEEKFVTAAYGKALHRESGEKSVTNPVENSSGAKYISLAEACYAV